MRVMCIDDAWEGEPVNRGWPLPKLMEVVTAINSETVDGDLYYRLEEYDGWFESISFVPISEIDETAMVREYNTQTA